jgi:DNA replication protein DnaC
MEKALDAELARALETGLPPSELIERLLAIEAGALIERRIERRIKESKLPERKLLTDFDFVFQTGVNKGQIMELATLGFIERKQGLILAGGSGTGKSHLIKALLLLACQRQYRCRYTTGADMLKDLFAGLADYSLERKLKSYILPEVLVIDDVGLDRLEQDDARNASLFLKVIEGRYCKGTTMVTTNISFDALGQYLGDPVITTAIVDRMIHHSIIIAIEGPSWRMHESQLLNAKAGKHETAAK